MYTKSLNKDGTLAHSYDCKMVFGRKDHECPRCVELINGAAPRAGWQKDYYENKKQMEDSDRMAREYHFNNCPICTGKERGVCTFGEW